MRTQGNFNNEFGVPQTIFNIEKSHEIAVVEMGMNSFGEIRRLSKVVRPDIVLIINISDSHIGNLGSMENIFEAKCEIFEYMSDDAAVVLNGDDDYLKTLFDMKPIFFGKDKQNDVSLEQIVHADKNSMQIDADCEGEIITLVIPQSGEFMIYPTLAAVAIGKQLGMSNEQIGRGVENYVPALQRMDEIETDRITIINSVYNASKKSILSNASMLKFYSGRSVVIVGDVLELGEFGQSIHTEIGEALGLLDIDIIICVGELVQFIKQGASSNSHGSVYYYQTQQALFDDLDTLIETGDTVLVKASRGMHFENIVENLKQL